MYAIRSYYAVVQRGAALMDAVTNQADFKATVESFGRVSNLAAKASAMKVRFDLLSDPAEQELYDAWRSMTEDYRSKLTERHEAEALNLLGGLQRNNFV